MRERPILFSGPMVRAILEGRKTQTRRVVKPLPPEIDVRGPKWVPNATDIAAGWRSRYGQPGDHLWVRETWGLARFHDDGEVDDWIGKLPDTKPAAYSVVYAADPHWPAHFDDRGFNWRPGIFTKRWASRITLEVTGVRVERLHDITEADAKAEGVEAAPFCKAGRPAGMEHVEAFEDLWCDINGAESWDTNPWVWVVEFRRLP
jgi:hypothetical protein